MPPFLTLGSGQRKTRRRVPAVATESAPTRTRPRTFRPGDGRISGRSSTPRSSRSGLCTGCAGCVVACPHDVIGYDHVEKGYKPFHLEEELGPDNCIHGEKGCTSCTRACPRFRTWEPEADMHLFGRVREPNEMYGITKDLLLCRASDDIRAQDRPGRRLRVGPADLGDGRGLHRLRAHVVPRGRRHVVEGDPGPRPQQGRDPRLGRLAATRTRRTPSP